MSKDKRECVCVPQASGSVHLSVQKPHVAHLQSRHCAALYFGSQMKEHARYAVSPRMPDAQPWRPVPAVAPSWTPSSAVESSAMASKPTAGLSLGPVDEGALHHVQALHLHIVQTPGTLWSRRPTSNETCTPPYHSAAPASHLPGTAGRSCTCTWRMLPTPPCGRMPAFRSLREWHRRVPATHNPPHSVPSHLHPKGHPKRPRRTCTPCSGSSCSAPMRGHHHTPARTKRSPLCNTAELVAKVLTGGRARVAHDARVARWRGGGVLGGRRSCCAVFRRRGESRRFRRRVARARQAEVAPLALCVHEANHRRSGAHTGCGSRSSSLIGCTRAGDDNATRFDGRARGVLCQFATMICLTAILAVLGRKVGVAERVAALVHEVVGQEGVARWASLAEGAALARAPAAVSVVIVGRAPLGALVELGVALVLRLARAPAASLALAFCTVTVAIIFRAEILAIEKRDVAGARRPARFLSEELASLHIQLSKRCRTYRTASRLPHRSRTARRAGKTRSLCICTSRSAPRDSRRCTTTGTALRRRRPPQTIRTRRNHKPGTCTGRSAPACC
eukprot:39128-Prymnesium_polylepis.1